MWLSLFVIYKGGSFMVNLSQKSNFLTNAQFYILVDELSVFPNIDTSDQQVNKDLFDENSSSVDVTWLLATLATSATSVAEYGYKTFKGFLWCLGYRKANNEMTRKAVTNLLGMINENKEYDSSNDNAFKYSGAFKDLIDSLGGKNKVLESIKNKSNYDRNKSIADVDSWGFSNFLTRGKI